MSASQVCNRCDSRRVITKFRERTDGRILGTCRECETKQRAERREKAAHTTTCAPVKAAAKKKVEKKAALRPGPHTAADQRRDESKVKAPRKAETRERINPRAW